MYKVEKYFAVIIVRTIHNLNKMAVSRYDLMLSVSEYYSVK